jgi:hypothetical protein
MPRIPYRKFVPLAFLCLLIFLAYGIQAKDGINSFEPRFALVIGNADYGELGKLKNPVNDANDMAASLKRLGFTVELLLNSELPQMENAVVRLSEKLAGASQSTGVFYFAGHGVQTQKGENYLIPVLTNIPAETFLKTKALALQSVLDSMQSGGNKLNLVFLDACRNNPFGWSRGTTRGLSIISAQPPGSIIVYATGAGSVAQDGTGRNGVFTGELLKNLETPGIDLNTMMDRTAQGVLAATKNQQNPAVYKQFFGTEFLAGGNGQTKPVISPNVTQSSDNGPQFGTLEITPGSLSVSLTTAGTLEIAGKTINIPAGGSLPIKNLKPGDYTLTVRYPDGKIESKTIEIIAGQAVNLSFTYLPTKINNSVTENFLFPVEGVTLGKTTKQELAIKGKKDDEYGCYTINGLNFWCGGTEVAETITLSYHSILPGKWQDNGMDWKLSYNQWMALLKRLGCTVAETEPPVIEHGSFSAILTAFYSAGGFKYKIELDFSYREGTTRNDFNTLFSIYVSAIPSKIDIYGLPRDFLWELH